MAVDGGAVGGAVAVGGGAVGAMGGAVAGAIATNHMVGAGLGQG